MVLSKLMAFPWDFNGNLMAIFYSSVISHVRFILSINEALKVGFVVNHVFDNLISDLFM